MGFAPPYQISDNNGGSVSSGSAWSMTNNVNAGHSVLTCVQIKGTDTVASITGLGASWAKIIAIQRGSSGSFLELWLGNGATGGTKAITVTTTSATVYAGWAMELDPVGSAASGGSTKTSSATPSLTVTGITAGSLVVADYTVASGLTSAGPVAPWTDYNKTGFKYASGQDIAYQLATSSANQTATWTLPSASNWGISAVILSPPTAVSEPAVMII